MLHCLNAIVDTVPEKFTNPFGYEPHPLCIAAAEQVKQAVDSHPDWKKDAALGKMFGVLVVQVPNAPLGEEIQFVAAYSGFLCGRNDIDYFVPPIYDLLLPQGRFQIEQAEISHINEQIRDLEVHGNADTFTQAYSESERSYICQLKRLRKQKSEELQDWLFEQYICLNARGEERSVMQIFPDFYRTTMLNLKNFEKNAKKHHIPSGSGECCAPKLLQYAFAHHLKPLCMAEFWIGASPREEVRHEGQFYPACRKKCRPILKFMLQGLDVEESKYEQYNAQLLKEIEIIYEDEYMLAINKPSGLLSVPSRESNVSVVDWLQRRYTNMEECYTPAHRLDQGTSGILLIAKNVKVLSRLNKAFAQHKVRKQYIAVLEKPLAVTEGVIDLPLTKDSNDPPRQMVDRVRGKQAVTRYEVVGRINDSTGAEHPVVAFYPETGRTHQLRMHSAHEEGLYSPICGDELYGNKEICNIFPRLMLHASSIEFNHPITGQPLTITCPPPFNPCSSAPI